MATTETIATSISDNAAGPKKVMADGVMVEQHDIDDQIKAADYARGQTSAKKNHRGLRVTKLLPSGP